MARLYTITIPLLIVVVALASGSPVFGDFAPVEGSLILNPQTACTGETVQLTGIYPGFTENPCPYGVSCGAALTHEGLLSAHFDCTFPPTYDENTGVVTLACDAVFASSASSAACGEHTLTLNLEASGTAVASASATFTVGGTCCPTMDLTASSHCSGANDAVYTFHAENPGDDPQTETVVGFSLGVPDGYSINPTYLTNVPGIVVMTGSYGDAARSIKGYLKLVTTTISGQFALYANDVETPDLWNPAGTVTITIPGNIVGFLTYVNVGEHIDLAFVAGFFVNPSEPGAYRWTAEATYPDGTVTDAVPRLGFTNQVDITACAVGGVAIPVNTLALVVPWLAVVGLVGCIATVAVIVRKRRP